MIHSEPRTRKSIPCQPAVGLWTHCKTRPWPYNRAPYAIPSIDEPERCIPRELSISRDVLQYRIDATLIREQPMCGKFCYSNIRWKISLRLILLAHTNLAKNGRLKPWTTEQSVSKLKQTYKRFDLHNIPLSRSSIENHSPQYSFS